MAIDEELSIHNGRIASRWIWRQLAGFVESIKHSRLIHVPVRSLIDEGLSLRSLISERVDRIQ